MLSDSAFNALLKTLEEPPEHAVFILATTEYYKVPATILSRCQQFLFSKINPVEAKKRLLEVAAKENISLTGNAASLIARLSDGAMRDAWSLLDQCVSSVGGQVDEEAVRACSGVADSGYLFSVTEAAINHKPAAALKLLDDLIGAGKDILRFTEELTLHIRNIMLAKSVGTEFIKGTDEELKRYKEQSERLSIDEIMRQVDLISGSLDNINRMKQTGQGRLLTEQLLIRLCSPNISTDAGSLAARLGALENRINNFSLNFAAVNSKSESDTHDKPKTESEPPPISENKNVSAAQNISAKQLAPPEKTRENVSANTKADFIPEFDARQVSEPLPAIYETDIPLPEPPPLDYGYEYIPTFEEPVFETSAKAASKSDFPAAAKTDKPKAEINTAAAEDKRSNAEISTPKSAPKTEAETQTDINKSETDNTAKDNLSTEADNPTGKTADTITSGKEDTAADTKTGAEKASSALPITESNIELPENIQPLPQWGDIIALLPASSKNILNKAEAFLYEGKIYVQAPPSALSMMKSGRRAVKLRDAVKAVMGGKLDIFTLPEKTGGGEEKQDLVSPFLERAKEMGIDVIIKHR